MRYAIKTALTGAALFTACAAQAEVIETSDNGFVTRDTAVVEADLTQTWLALISPAQWWSSQHTWSADAANLRLTPQAGGCFCEKIPEVDEPDRFTLEGSVEHMRVIQAYPNSALRMIGALGPLQSEPVTGVLTIALTEVELPEDEFGRKGTRIVWEYNVGGPMRYEIPVISKAVDGVMSLQLEGLAEKLGKVDGLGEDEGEDESEDADASLDEGKDGEEAASADGVSDEADGADATEPTDTAKEDAGEEEPAAKKEPSVDEAFGDFGDFGEDSPVSEPEEASDKPAKGPPGASL